MTINTLTTSIYTDDKTTRVFTWQMPLSFETDTILSLTANPTLAKDIPDTTIDFTIAAKTR